MSLGIPYCCKFEIVDFKPKNPMLKIVHVYERHIDEAKNTVDLL